MAITVRVWSGRETRALREAKRMSLNAFARHLGVSSRVVSKWEAAGERMCPRPVNQEALDTTLARSSAEEQARFAAFLGVADGQGDDAVRPSSASVEVAAVKGSAVRTPVIGGADAMISGADVDRLLAAAGWWEAVMSMDRRAALSALAGLTTALWLGQPAQAAAEVPFLRPDGDLRDALAAMRTLHGVLAGQDNMLGAAAVLPIAVHQVRILRNLASQAAGAGRRAALDLQATFAEFAGWLGDDLGDRPSGQQWISNALLWAHEADDEALVAYILMRQSQRASEAGGTAAAISLAQSAQRRGGLTHRVRAAAALAEACGHAAHGDTVSFATAIDTARDLTGHATALTLHDWAPWCTPGYVTVHEAKGWAALGEHQRAIAAYEQALTGWPTEMQRDRGLYLGRMASSHACTGDTDQAVFVGRTALAIARETRSARILDELRPLRRTLGSSPTRPLIQAFTSELEQAITTARALPENGTAAV